MKYAERWAIIRKWSRGIHRDTSFFFAGIIVVYAVSGIAMNHRDSINPHYDLHRIEYTLPHPYPAGSKPDKAEVLSLLHPLGEEGNYTKHYFPRPGEMKVFLKNGSNLIVNMAEGNAVYEKLTRKPLLSAFATLHYNPGRWWTYFADIFAVGLLLITITGVVMIKGSKGIWGRGGLEMLAGIMIPVIWFLIA